MELAQVKVDLGRREALLERLEHVPSALLDPLRRVERERCAAATMCAARATATGATATAERAAKVLLARLGARAARLAGRRAHCHSIRFRSHRQRASPESLVGHRV